jgi:glycosyltransferase involved in cell wall biosynthesis
MRIYIVIPAYNEAKRIDGVLTALKGFNLPIIIVDDGSNDHTLESSKEHGVIALRHRVNLGKGAAIKTGCEAAFSMGADAIIMMDSDGQHKAEDLPKFLEKIESGKVDIAFGSRNMNMGVPLVRFMGNKMASVLISFLFGVYISDLICGYRALTRKAYDVMKLKSSDYGIETEMVVKAAKYKLRYCEIPVETIYYDKFKGVTILDAFGILLNVLKWRIIR